MCHTNINLKFQGVGSRGRIYKSTCFLKERTEKNNMQKLLIWKRLYDICMPISESWNSWWNDIKFINDQSNRKSDKCCKLSSARQCSDQDKEKLLFHWACTSSNIREFLWYISTMPKYYLQYVSDAKQFRSQKENHYN